MLVALEYYRTTIFSEFGRVGYYILIEQEPVRGTPHLCFRSMKVILRVSLTEVGNRSSIQRLAGLENPENTRATENSFNHSLNNIYKIHLS